MAKSNEETIEEKNDLDSEIRSGTIQKKKKEEEEEEEEEEELNLFIMPTSPKKEAEVIIEVKNVKNVVAVVVVVVVVVVDWKTSERHHHSLPLTQLVGIGHDSAQASTEPINPFLNGLVIWWFGLGLGLGFGLGLSFFNQFELGLGCLELNPNRFGSNLLPN